MGGSFAPDYAKRPKDERKKVIGWQLVRNPKNIDIKEVIKAKE